MIILLQKDEGIERVLTLMLINLCFPHLRSECQSLCSIPLSSFNSIPSIQEYADAIIKSGVTEDLRGRIFVLGNSGVGKSSFVQTLKSYGEEPENTKLFLTEDDENKDKTIFLDLIPDAKLSGAITFKIKKRKSQ